MKHPEVTKTEIVWIALNPEILEEQERFWSKVRISDGCWEWTGGVSKRKSLCIYGNFISRFFGRGVPSHRMAFLFSRGFLPLGQHVVIRHSCNNTRCCNPSHLSIGTQSDNIADMVAANRQMHGENHYLTKEPWRIPRGSQRGNSKLNEDVVAAMRLKYATTNLTHEDLANEIGVSRESMRDAIKGVTYSHVPNPVKSRKRGPVPKKS